MTSPIPNVFSDEDLKRVKECRKNHTHAPWACFQFQEMGDALLSRLECAEDCIDDHRRSCLHDIGNPCDCRYQLRLDAWKQSKTERSR